MDNLFGGGLAQGPWVSYYDNGLKKEEGNSEEIEIENEPDNKSTE